MSGRDDWQPIETAPKDGTIVRIHFADGVQDERYWKAGGIEGWCRDIGWPVVQNIRLIEPTHWMPLPPPPALEQRKTEGV